ncbi:hypothetical protein QQY66_24780 [Streptomyces sp. DG2A-72]|uniref:hypothetical protein n=1 Tax=Streptomyces sp. DG2A-72 TaxID=3051386 RepID=UPI00265BC51A|nr:hypothetical protein [Streptomyces sp. DG2A-72]MDO0934740.1 hypothetical protein [Streptomyces sp. DG2A-72]
MANAGQSGKGAAAAASATSTSAEACYKLTSETTEGPYYLDADKLRGRCVHIHTTVHVDGEWTDAGYEGGTTCHTGQFFFDEESVLASAGVEPYSTSTTERTTLTEDTIYDQSGSTGGLLKLKYDKDNIAKGVQASITVGVDLEATNEGTSM